MNDSYLIESFLEMMLSESGASENTIIAYKNDLLALNDYLEEQKLGFKKALENDLRGFIASLSNKGFTKKTQRRKISAIKMFYKFLFNEEIIKKNPTDNLDSPKAGKPLPKYLSEKEINLLLDTAKTINGIEGIKTRALFEILYSTGLRVSELVSLPFSAVARKQKIIIVRGKGNKERLVPLGDYAREAVDKWLEYLLENKKKQMPKWLFPSPSKSGHLTRNGFFKILQKLAIKAGISPDRVSPHVIRHSFASHLVANDADLRTVQKMLGHADISTTEIYTHILDEKLASVVTNFHPLSKK